MADATVARMASSTDAPEKSMSVRPPDLAAPPSLSVIIPHFNDLANLDLCLALLQQQTVGAGSFETIVADNNSSCDRHELEAVCRGRARLIDAPIQGAAAARNTGVAASRGEVLAFLDSDCRPVPTWIKAGVAALAAADMVGGQVEVAVDDPARLTAAEAFETVFAFNNERYIREEQFSVTANMFTTRAVFDRVGGFRARVSEDVDWGRRAHAMGFRWTYAPAALVAHPARRTTDDLVRKWRRITAEAFALARERPGGRAKWLARNWLMLLSLPVFVARAWTSRRLSLLRDRLAVVRILVWMRWWRFREAHRLALTR